MLPALDLAMENEPGIVAVATPDLDEAAGAAGTAGPAA